MGSTRVGAGRITVARLAAALAFGLLLAPDASTAAGASPARGGGKVGPPVDQVQALLEQARAAYAKLEYERALELTHRAGEFSRNADDDVKISLVEGVMLYSLGRDDEADAAFRKAVALDPEAKLSFPGACARSEAAAGPNIKHNPSGNRPSLLRNGALTHDLCIALL